MHFDNPFYEIIDQYPKHKRDFKKGNGKLRLTDEDFANYTPIVINYIPGSAGSIVEYLISRSTNIWNKPFKIENYLSTSGAVEANRNDTLDVLHKSYFKNFNNVSTEQLSKDFKDFLNDNEHFEDFKMLIKTNQTTCHGFKLYKAVEVFTTVFPKTNVITIKPNLEYVIPSYIKKLSTPDIEYHKKFLSNINEYKLWNQGYKLESKYVFEKNNVLVQKIEEATGLKIDKSVFDYHWQEWLSHQNFKLTKTQIKIYKSVIPDDIKLR